MIIPILKMRLNIQNLNRFLIEFSYESCFD
nr:MAG TPA: hypothetical protein [Caudoviricetes sp.]